MRIMLKLKIVLIGLLLSAFFPLVAQQINYENYKTKYPDSEYVILENKYERAEPVLFFILVEPAELGIKGC